MARRLSLSFCLPVLGINDSDDDFIPYHDGASESLKHALHEELLPHTVSTDSSPRSSASSSFEEQITFLAEFCPVTGMYADILDDYDVLPHVLGTGHHGCVRECVHKETRQIFAVKSIEKDKIGRFDHLLREITLLSKMDHYAIIKMADCYEDEDYVHIVTERYTGGELFDKIIEKTTDDGCFPEAKAKPIIKSLLEAVKYLHGHGIVHRDIKPENVLFESNEEDSPVRLIDFGLSRIHREGDAPMSNPVGTSYYMSPELLQRQYDRSTDVWSIGIIAYILLCGYPPFNGGSDPQIHDSIRRGGFRFSGPGWKEVSDGAKDFIKCLLRRDPRERLTAEEALQHPWIMKQTM